MDGAVVGVYAGASVDGASSIQGLADALTAQAASSSMASVSVAQYCGHNIDGGHTVGVVVVRALADLDVAQDVMQSWQNGTCYTDLDSSSSTAVSLFTKPLPAPSRNTTSVLRRQSSSGTCSTVEVVSGDSCSSLAAECGITAAEFTDFNPSSTLCSALQAGQHVCCSAGSLPDFAPQPQADGSCYAYTVQTNDNCDLLASEYSITESDITNFNTETWGWEGCSDVQLGQIICLSTGRFLVLLTVPPQINVFYKVRHPFRCRL
jgi:chitinase